MTLTDAFFAGRSAVEQFEAWCTKHRWIFQRVNGENDVGKDGYVDVSDNTTVTGEMFAVQVKGGSSYAASGGYRIRVEGHLRLWRDSSIPVIGIVLGTDEVFRWTNLTVALREDPEAASVLVPTAARLDHLDQVMFLLDSVRATHVRTGLPVALASDSPDEQSVAISDCFGMARQDPAYLIAVRRALCGLRGRGFFQAVQALSMCTTRADVFWTPGVWLPEHVQKAVFASMRWTVQEAWYILSHVEEGGFAPGTFGHSVLKLLAADPNPPALARSVALASVATDQRTAYFATLLYLDASGDKGPERWNELRMRMPAFGQLELADWIDETFHDGDVVRLY